jgi:hypothetical protein
MKWVLMVAFGLPAVKSIALVVLAAALAGCGSTRSTQTDDPLAKVRAGMSLEEFREAVPAAAGRDATAEDQLSSHDYVLTQRELAAAAAAGKLRLYQLEHLYRYTGKRETARFLFRDDMLFEWQKAKGGVVYSVPRHNGSRQIESATTEDLLRQMRQQDQERQMREMENRIRRLEAAEDR